MHTNTNQQSLRRKIMKKVIALILVTLMVTMLLAGCSNSSEVTELRQEVENLQSELSQVKEQMSETTETQLAEEKLSETTTKTVTSYMLDYLTTQLKSNYYADWNAVATCNYATEEHLLTAAKQCAAIPGYSCKEDWAKTIATSICENPAVSGKVLKELASSNYTSVIAIAHAKLEEMQ